MYTLTQSLNNEIDPQDELIVFHLLDDETFKESRVRIRKLQKMYPDWRTDQLVYEFLDGSAKYSILRWDR